MAHNRETIIYPNAYTILRKQLRAALAVPVYVAREPNPRPEEFIMLTPSGGEELSPAHAARACIVDAWADDEHKAYTLAEKARAHLKTIAGVYDGTTVYGCRPLGGIVWMPDTDADIPRFRQNFTITLRGKAA